MQRSKKKTSETKMAKNPVSEETVRRWIVKLQFVSVTLAELNADLILHGMPPQASPFPSMIERLEEMAAKHAQALTHFYSKPKIARPNDG